MSDQHATPVGRVLSQQNVTLLTDYGFYMIGRNRLDFHRGMFRERDQDPATFDDRWNVFHQWQSWLHESAKKPPQSDAEGSR